MMVSLWFIAIPLLAASAWIVHGSIIASRAHRRYDELAERWNRRKSLHDKLHSEFYSWASTKDRGCLTPMQEYELSVIMNECRSISQQMAECAEEF